MSIPRLSYREYIFRTLDDRWALHCKRHGIVVLTTKDRPAYDVECPHCVSDQTAKRA